jgi:hypothetical protein
VQQEATSTVAELNAFIQSLIPPLLVVAAMFILVMRKQTLPIADQRMIQMIDRLQKRVEILEEKLSLVQAWATKLSTQVVELGGKPIGIADIEPSSDGSIHLIAREPAKLLGLLRDHFSLDELESIAFEIGAKAGTLGDGNIDARALRLVRYAENNDRMLALAFAVWRERPNEARLR